MGGYVPVFISVMIPCLISGCTSAQLRTSTIRQAKTLTEIQYEQVLNNLAMFCLDPSALPSLISLKSGSTQIGDTGQVGFLGVAGLSTQFGSSPTVLASRSVVDQWGTAPVTDDNILRVLRMAYQNAIGHPRFLLEEEANDLAHDLSQQIGTNADISTDLEVIRALATVYGSKDQPSEGESRGRRGESEGPVAPPKRPSGRPGTGSTNIRNPRDYADAISKGVRIFDETIMNTLDEEFLEFNQKGNPCAGFRIRYTKDPQTRKPPKEPTEAELAKIADLERRLEEIRPDYKIVRIAGSTGLTKETVRRINNIQKELCDIATKLPPGWFHYGCKGDIPKNACYVGHFQSRCGECYVWVCADGLPALADFTLSILNLSTIFQESQVLTVPTGIQFSPAFRLGR